MTTVGYDRNMTNRPEFRLPWTNGARAYPEADTFAAAREGFKRRRKDVMFKMTNTGEAGTRPCTVCGGTLSEPALAVDRPGLQMPAAEKVDRWSTWTYSAKRKQVGNGRHYVCSWGALLVQVFKAA